MQDRRKSKELSREEDYRDYEDRELREGWPYSDADGTPSSRPRNSAYGDTPANFDEEPDPGFELDEADVAGREEIRETAMPLPSDRIDSDELEAVITERLEQIGVDTDGIDVRVEKGIVTLEGGVDTETSVRRIGEIVQSVSGVTSVRNQLQPLGADAHITPRE